MKVARTFVVTEGALLDSNVPETEAAWAAGSYAKDAVVYRPVDGIHRRFVSLVATNTADPADGDATKWRDDGPTNRWAVFDQRQQQQTTNADSLYYKLQLAGRIDAFYAANISGETLRLRLTDPADGGAVRYDQTFLITSDSGITDWLAWTVEPIVSLRDFGRTDLPALYSDLILEVWIVDTGSTVACGELVTGLTRELGGTQWGATLGNKSYSSLGEDTFGSDDIVKRGKKRTAEFDVVVDNFHLDEVTTLLDDLDATAVLFIGHESFAAFFIFGVLTSWKEVVRVKQRTFLNISLQSFTRS
jgi:hypothetical protein